MDVLLLFLPVLGCAVMMAVCMGLMGGARRLRRRRDEPSEAADPEVAALREEVARLRAERSDDARGVDG